MNNTSKRNKLLEIIGLALVIVLSLVSCRSNSPSQLAASAGNAFMQALKQNNNPVSWNLLTPDYQNEIGGEAAWADYTQPRRFSKWSFDTVTVFGNTAVLSGEARLNLDIYTVTIEMRSDQGNWLIAGIDFSLK